jgi:hypothetical protein
MLSTFYMFIYIVSCSVFVYIEFSAVVRALLLILSAVTRALLLTLSLYLLCQLLRVRFCLLFVSCCSYA